MIPKILIWQVIGGLVIVIMLPLVSLTTQSASYVFTKFDMATEQTGVSSKPYAVILSVLVSQYSLYGYDAAAHLTEETKGADKNGPIAILSSIGIISIFGWAYILALTFSIRVHYVDDDLLVISLFLVSDVVLSLYICFISGFWLFV